VTDQREKKGEIVKELASAHDLRRAFGFRWSRRVSLRRYFCFAGNYLCVDVRNLPALHVSSGYTVVRPKTTTRDGSKSGQQLVLGITEVLHIRCTWRNVMAGPREGPRRV